MQIQINKNQREMKHHGEFAFPFLVSKEDIRNYEFSTFSWHWHPEVEVTLVEEGEMIYQTNGATYHLRAGDVLFGNSNTLHSGHAIDGKNCSYWSVTFDPKLIYGFEGSLFQKKYVDPLVKNDGLASFHFDGRELWHGALRENLEKVIRLWEEEDAFYELRIQGVLVEIWLFLLQHEEILSSEESALKAKEVERIKKVLTFIHENYDKKITLDDIANSIHLCKSECSRFFKKHMRESLFDYLQRYRVERSIVFLENPDVSITEAAYACGFGDPGYYSKVFRKYMGRSPREYRKGEGRS